MKKIQSVRGTHDLLGGDLLLYKKVAKVVFETAHSYDFLEIVTPIFESTSLFNKTLGVNSDVVLKEMYTFEDRNKDFLTLRPEYTTPIIRAAISNNLLSKLPTKIFGMGPMFRRERPQKGRYRQFNQINFEIFGSQDPITDVELIILAKEILCSLDLQDKVTLFINSLGDKNTLLKYNENLKDYFQKYKSDLSDESKLKIETNPLRILDSKDLKDIEINHNAPKIDKYYSPNARKLFDEVLNLLNKSNINFELDRKLVRGLEYYCHTVFEFKTKDQVSQNTIIGGGRYDGLVKVIGGPDIPGVGWACGVERLIMMQNIKESNTVSAQLVIMEENLKDYGLELLIRLRKLNLKIKFDYKYNLKKSLSDANNFKIKYLIIIGENEKNKNNYTLKNMSAGDQRSVNFKELVNILKT